MEARIIFANISWWLLIFILYLRPVLEIVNYRKLFFLLRYRKILGIICGLAAFLHVFFYLKEADALFDYFHSSIYWRLDNLLGWGSLALIAIFFPLITSNRFAQKKLKRNWKKIQQVSYLAFILTAIHIFFIKGDWGVILIVIVWMLIWLWAYFKRRYRKNK